MKQNLRYIKSLESFFFNYKYNQTSFANISQIVCNSKFTVYIAVLCALWHVKHDKTINTILIHKKVQVYLYVNGAGPAGVISHLKVESPLGFVDEPEGRKDGENNGALAVILLHPQVQAVTVGRFSIYTLKPNIGIITKLF